MRNCPEGALSKAQSLLRTLAEVDPYLIRMWEKGGESFTPEVNDKMAKIVEMIDCAEEKLEAAKLLLATFFPGHPDQKDQTHRA